MGKALTIKFDPSLLNKQLDKMGGAALSAVRPAAQAGSQVFYEEMLLRVPVGKKEFHWFHGKSFKTTGKKYPYNKGDLKRAIYQAFSEDKSVVSPFAASKGGYAVATYHVQWRHGDTAGFKGAPYGFMVERGTSRAPAHPFMRPSFDAKRVAALQAAEARWIAETQKAL